MLPRTRFEALNWGRRLPAWEEHRGIFTDQAIAVARTISCRAMREYGLTFTTEARVVEQGIRPTPRPTSFRVAIAGEELDVRHTRDYYPGQDSVYYTVEPSHPNCLSETGFWHQFVPSDAVEAVGGPEVFSRLLAEARIASQEEAFMRAFEGKLPEVKGRKRRAEPAVEAVESALPEEPPPEQPVQHASQVVERRGKPEKGLLF